MSFVTYKNVGSLGNVLVDYFYQLAKSMLEGQSAFQVKPFRDNFIQHLPSFISLTDAHQNRWWEPIQSVKDNFSLYEITSKEFLLHTCSVCIWFVDHPFLEKFWFCMYPLVHAILDFSLKKSGLAIPPLPFVIHFRCADTPFVRHSKYHLQKHSFFENALKSFSLPTHTPLLLLSCHDHMAQPEYKKACQKYSFHIVQFLRSLGYAKITTQCKSNVEDFATMFYADHVLSTVSSFSFMAGYFGRGKFLSACHCQEENFYKNSPPTVPWMLCGYDIPHHFVPDYLDTEKVHEIISSSTEKK